MTHHQDIVSRLLTNIAPEHRIESVIDMLGETSYQIYVAPENISKVKSFTEKYKLITQKVIIKSNTRPLNIIQEGYYINRHIDMWWSITLTSDNTDYFTAWGKLGREMMESKRITHQRAKFVINKKLNNGYEFLSPFSEKMPKIEPINFLEELKNL